MEVIIFLHRLVSVLVEYFKALEEESIRDNFVIIYELMDEMMDYGFPQTTETKILQECVISFTVLSYSLNHKYPDTSPRSHIRWKYKFDRPLASQTLFHGGLRG